MRKPSPIPFEKAMAVPPGKYRTPMPCDARRGVLLGDIGEFAITNHNSQYPIIGSCDSNAAITVLLHNPKQRCAGVYIASPTHAEKDEKYILRQLTREMRTSFHERIDVSIIGASHAGKAGNDHGNSTVSRLETVLAAIFCDASMHLRTFDVYIKAKPCEVAIETFTGTLIRGTESVRYEGDQFKTASLFQGWNKESGFIRAGFNATLPDHEIA